MDRTMIEGGGHWYPFPHLDAQQCRQLFVPYLMTASRNPHREVFVSSLKIRCGIAHHNRVMTINPSRSMALGTGNVPNESDAGCRLNILSILSIEVRWGRLWRALLSQTYMPWWCHLSFRTSKVLGINLVNSINSFLFCSLFVLIVLGDAFLLISSRY
ncbi:hypothetical protein F4806DRAFT_482383 [Annulohypoxylon nitens]|nr:hypothetical protein F4806DRAFT_482383 [Annulohypoxylon nitens]